MPKTKEWKLVRNQVPDLIERDTGERPPTRNPTGRDLLIAQGKKVAEEAQEVLNVIKDNVTTDKIRELLPEEVADLLLAVETLLGGLGISYDVVGVAAQKKTAEKGSFSMGIEAYVSSSN